MKDIKITYSEIILYLEIINIILGILFGSFPLISGLILKNRKYGFYGFIISILGGAILGVFLSYPIAAVFTWLILRKAITKANSPATLDSPESAPEDSISEASDSEVVDSSDSNSSSSDNS